MKITWQVHTTGVGFAGFAKQNAFAVANAINRTLDEGQIAQRAGIHARFTLRGRAVSFIDRMVKRRREDFAQRDRVIGRLRIEGPEGDYGRGAILARHESGGVRTTGQGGASVDPRQRLAAYFYLPQRALRSSFASSVARRYYPANLRLMDRRDIDGTLPAQVHTTKRGKYQLKGKDRTFVIFSASGSGAVPFGIFQRKGGRSGRATARHGKYEDGRRFGQRDPNLTKLWGFKRQVALKPRLQFVDTQRRTVTDRFAINYRGMLSAAIRTAR